MSLVDAATVARELGVSREFVYRNAARFGALRLSDSPNGPLRFGAARFAYRLGRLAINRSLDPAPG